MKRTAAYIVALSLLAAVTAMAAVLRFHGREQIGVDDTITHASVVVWSVPRDRTRAENRAPGGVDALTAHNDVARLGWNARESVLTTTNVNPRSFGKLFDVPVDGQVYAQPLVVSGILLPGAGRRNVLIVATENDSVYELDADTGATLWHHTFAGCCGVSAVPAGRVNVCPQISPRIGISSTPVIDRRSETVDVVAKTMVVGTPATFHNTLHALSLTTGADVRPPAEITATVQLSWRGVFAPGHSMRHSLKRFLGGSLRFDPRIQFNRPGLLLAHGNVYVAFGSHCDAPEAHGWVFAYDARDLHRVSAFVTIGDWNDVNGGGVWQSGFGLTGDSAGNVYFMTGNGPFNANQGGRDFGSSLLKLTPDLDRVLDSFTPFTQAELTENDADFGGAGMMVLPDGAGRPAHLAVASSKVRAIFLLDREHLGGYTEGGPDRVVQVLGDEHSQTRWCIGTCGGPAYYAGPGGEYVFNVWGLDAMRAYRLERHGRRPRLVETSHSPNAFPGPGGAIPSVSSNGLRPGIGIVWATTRSEIPTIATKPLELYAYDASNVARPLYHGAISFWRNQIAIAFLTPTIAHGKVYVGGDGSVSVFGLRPPGRAIAPASRSLPRTAWHRAGSGARRDSDVKPPPRSIQE